MHSSVATSTDHDDRTASGATPHRALSGHASLQTACGDAPTRPRVVPTATDADLGRHIADVRCDARIVAIARDDGRLALLTGTSITVTSVSFVSDIVHLTPHCASDRRGEVSCWDTSGAHVARVYGLGPVVDVAEVDTAVCFLGADGMTRCARFLFDEGSLLGAATVIPGAANGVRLEANGNNMCSLTQQTGMQCWTPPGPRVIPSMAFVGLPGANMSGGSTVAVNRGRVVDIGVGRESACYLDVDQGVFCTGCLVEPAAQGTRAFLAAPYPLRVAGLEHPVFIALGDFFGCAREASGATMCWGADPVDGVGAIVDGPFEVTAREYPRLRGVARICIAENRVCGVWPDGTGRCFGNASHASSAPALSAPASPSPAPPPAAPVGTHGH